MIPTSLKSSILLCMIVAAILAVPGIANAQSGQRVVAVVNDQPITDYDIDQRMKLNSILGFTSGGSTEQQRKATLQELIEDMLKRVEAERLQVSVSDQQVDATLARMAASSGTSVDGLKARLSKNGINIGTLKRRIEANLTWNRILNARYNINVEVDDGEIDRRLKAINEDPARQPRTAYRLQEIQLPLDANAASNDQLVYARFVEAQRIMQRFTDCSNTREAASGIFNVQIRNPVDVPPDKLPKPLKQALDKVGPGKVVGPNRAKSGVQLIAFCARRSIAPPPISRDQVENMLVNERYGMYGDRYLRDIKRNAFVDYKVPSYKP
ncbi:SurA N-terminal domain-containing protein [Kaustia mangrovi]|uniref:SurA N-terminal domain-containing protein n=1 Tax=Kaustia mangrovi TaxID=2593653 RepID=A0A7S8C7B2_9HYPH|nr:SurA N-terminal domain-containing protein [Kaustia mangrovi]QPC44702.1 SurA N-terminal domain-containing protein [Kaustia mangrovi]